MKVKKVTSKNNKKGIEEYGGRFMTIEEIEANRIKAYKIIF